jgi:hypothetical protein
MNEQNNDNSPAFMEATSRKFEDQERKINLLEEKIAYAPNNTELLQDMRDSLDELMTEVKTSRFPAEKMNDFSIRLDMAIGILTNPVKNEVRHHHHVPKLIWITAGLFLVLTLVCAGWLDTSGKLANYIASDTKYRFLRLDTEQTGLQSWLDKIDSLYDIRSDLRITVLETEAKFQQNMEKLLKASRLKNDAKALEKAAKE